MAGGSVGNLVDRITTGVVVDFVDNDRGEWLETELGELENTLIMVISDNGASPEGGDVGSLQQVGNEILVVLDHLAVGALPHRGVPAIAGGDQPGPGKRQVVGHGLEFEATLHTRQRVGSGLPAQVHRGIRLPDEGGLPVVGRVAAGQPILAAEHIEDRLVIPPGFFHPRADFLLRVHGDSMKDVGILDGDLLAVHKTPEASNGQIVVARIDEEVEDIDDQVDQHEHD